MKPRPVNPAQLYNENYILKLNSYNLENKICELEGKIGELNGFIASLVDFSANSITVESSGNLIIIDCSGMINPVDYGDAIFIDSSENIMFYSDQDNECDDDMYYWMDQDRGFDLSKNPVKKRDWPYPYPYYPYDYPYSDLYYPYSRFYYPYRSMDANNAPTKKKLLQATRSRGFDMSKNPIAMPIKKRCWPYPYGGYFPFGGYYPYLYGGALGNDDLDYRSFDLSKNPMQPITREIHPDHRRRHHHHHRKHSNVIHYPNNNSDSDSDDDKAYDWINDYILPEQPKKGQEKHYYRNFNANALPQPVAHASADNSQKGLINHLQQKNASLNKIIMDQYKKLNTMSQ